MYILHVQVIELHEGKRGLIVKKLRKLFLNLLLKYF